MRVSRAISQLRRFKRGNDGAALVEFALILPAFLLAFFVVVEFGRLFFSYQAAVQGVRDATRYMARITNEDVCTNPSEANALNTFTETKTTRGAYSGITYYGIIERNMQTEVEALLPENVTLDEVRSNIFCINGSTGTYRTTTVPMAQIEADFNIVFPLVGILEINGQPLIESISHTVNDKTRVYGT